MSLSGDRRTVAGTEGVAVALDKPVTDLVFRLWPSGPISSAKGGSLTVTSVAGVAVAGTSLERRGTLYRIRLRTPIAAGAPINVTLHFTLRLPVGANERWGTRPSASWWGGGFPLLAWERGRGWAEEPATRLFAEAATSEVFRLAKLTVDAPATDSVLASGVQTGKNALPGGRNRWTFKANAVRDVAVASGRFAFARGRGAGGVPVTVGVTAGMSESPSKVLRVALATFASHVARFGPFPYEALSVPVIPDVNGGIEFPGLYYLGHNQLDATPSHELAHEWFYGLIGDDQARDPWLDEAFATYAEALARGTSSAYRSAAIPSSGLHRTGRPMTFWDPKGERTYYRSVYVQGAAALLRARQAVGAARFDAAIRCYVRANAHRVARPQDLARALSGLPAAVAILRRAGALP
ncbi:MAG: hypothetical protein QOJ92_885 [Frankiales bacterium]|nr:hypothetical protein [Frankiales bacterium]